MEFGIGGLIRFSPGSVCATWAQLPGCIVDDTDVTCSLGCDGLPSGGQEPSKLARFWSLVETGSEMPGGAAVGPGLMILARQSYAVCWVPDVVVPCVQPGLA